MPDNNYSGGIGIPKDIPVLDITEDGKTVDSGETISILMCSECLYGSPFNCPVGIYNRCHGLKNIKRTV